LENNKTEQAISNISSTRALGEAQRLKKFLDQKVDQFNRPDFIELDPVSVPHGFSRPQDIEIAAFFAAVFSWGNRRTIIRKANELMALMDQAPLEFCLHYGRKPSQAISAFRHRTFNSTDLCYFIAFLGHHFRQHLSLETAFTRGMGAEDRDMENGLNGFYRYFFSLAEGPIRTRKHIASPDKNSTCKRLNMFLRWMVRHDKRGVDFGIWKKISPAQLICPVDLHVARVARRLGLITRDQTDWRCAMELTGKLRDMDPLDPVKYDFALFGLGVQEHY
jgi:uncharacterized protein (TIGR02757 family)